MWTARKMVIPAARCIAHRTNLSARFAPNKRRHSNAQDIERELLRIGRIPHASHQITIEDHGAFTSAYVLSLNSLHPFRPTNENSFPTLFEAVEWAEKQAN